MRILVINGPNLNLVGRREPNIYGSQSFDNYFVELQNMFPDITLVYFQSNNEGALLDKLHEVGFDFEGIVANIGGYSHTSVALADAIAAITTPVVEVHISNIHAREQYRQHSYTAAKSVGSIAGLGLRGYELAVRFLTESSK